MKPERQSVALNEEEKLVLDTIKKSDSKELVAVKTAVGLSNKKWDTSIKGLTQKKVVKVVKNEEGLFIEMLN
jgi:lysyl-tRNA synthetase class 2